MSRILEKIGEIKEVLNQLSSFTPSTLEDYKSDTIKKAACEHYFEKTVQASEPMPGYENDPKAILASKLLNEFTIASTKVLNETELIEVQKMVSITETVNGTEIKIIDFWKSSATL